MIFVTTFTQRMWTKITEHLSDLRLWIHREMSELFLYQSGNGVGGRGTASRAELTRHPEACLWTHCARRDSRALLQEQAAFSDYDLNPWSLRLGERPAAVEGGSPCSLVHLEDMGENGEGRARVSSSSCIACRCELLKSFLEKSPVLSNGGAPLRSAATLALCVRLRMSSKRLSLYSH